MRNSRGALKFFVGVASVAFVGSAIWIVVCIYGLQAFGVGLRLVLSLAGPVVLGLVVGLVAVRRGYRAGVGAALTGAAAALAVLVVTYVVLIGMVARQSA